MVKNKNIFGGLLLLLCLTGCGKEEIPIVQEQEAWKCEDIEISGLPENAFVCDIVSNGIYYEIELDVDYSREEPATVNEYHFLDFWGNDRVILQKSDMNTYSIAQNGEDMLLCNTTEEGMEVLTLSQDGSVKTVFLQNAPQFPFIQTYGQYMVSIRNNFVDDTKKYENKLVLLDKEKDKETIIYCTMWDNERAVGEDLGCVSMDDKTVCFTLNRHYDNKKSEFILFVYDISADKIVKEIPLRTQAYYAAYGKEQNSLLLSETDEMTYMEEAGALGYIKDGAFVEQEKIPLISASNMIRDGAYTGKGYYFTTYKAAYYWNVKTNKIYVYDYEWCKDKEYKMLPTGEGLKFIVTDANRTFVRTLSVK